MDAPKPTEATGQLGGSTNDAVSVAPPATAPASGVTGANPSVPTENGINGKQEEAEAANTSKATTESPPKSIEINTSKPADFDGEVSTTNKLPSPETIKKIEDYIVLDRDGKSYTFKSLYSGRNVARRVLVLFIRHFFCGNCQEYLRTFADSISPDALLGLPVSTFVVVIGCGDPALIDMYVEATKCPFPIYTDPTRALFDELGMVKTLAMGAKPAYMRKSMTSSVIASIGQALRAVPRGMALKSGDQRQVGGEFLFEPLDLVTPINTPQDEQQKTLGSFEKPGVSGHENGEGDSAVEEKRVTWCHRMKSTRDHAEIPELMEILGLDGHGQPIKDKERWSRAVASRKGTGLTMADEMNKLNKENEGEAVAK